MSKYIIVLISGLFFSNIYAQSLILSIGPNYTTSNKIVPVKNGKMPFDVTDNSTMISYEHFLKQQPISIIASYSQYRGMTGIWFENGGVLDPYGNTLKAIGFSGANIHRLDVGATYDFMKRRRKFYLQAALGLGLQVSKVTGAEIFSVLLPGPFYTNSEPMTAESYNTSQIVPFVGVRTGFVFWKRLDIGLSFQGVYANKYFQKQFLKYSYKGIPQKTAEYGATGTGIFVSLGIGYRFVTAKRN